MAYWDGDFGTGVEEWYWKQKRVWWPLIQCKRSGRYLFLKKAYYGRCEYNNDMWLSKEEYMFAMLKGEFE